MKTLLLILMSALSAAAQVPRPRAAVQNSAGPQVRTPFWTRSTVAILSADAAIMVADIATTRQAIARGGHESNPVMQNPNAAIPFKVGGVAAFAGIGYALHRSGHDRAAKFVMITGGMPSLFAAVHNSQIRRTP